MSDGIQTIRYNVPFAFLCLSVKIYMEGRTREALIVFRVFCAFLLEVG
jgi:hypothetical protein